MMSLRLPNIRLGTPAEQVAQMQSYLYQLVEELNYALEVVNTAEKGDSSNVVVNATENEMTPEKAQATFSQIKSLIIKSADIVTAYQEEMKKSYDGQYVAISDFGTYQESTSHTIAENSEYILQAFTNISNLQTAIDGYEDALRETQAWVKTGLLETEEDETAIYGVEVGQISELDGVEVFNKYARFTAGGIYFYTPKSGNDPIAWMTGEKLYITNAEITGSLKLGGYMLDLSDGIAFKWVGMGV